MGAMGILVEWASWWNGHLGGTGILVERASCCGMGILLWNGHLGGTGILVERASCPFHSQSGCPYTAKEAENECEPLGGALRGGLS
ncbi:hypothetical protein [Moorena sp. SIO3B2]|uniref:hypothetical protein n=1 Tax=Moorena sp. SIO3B2 TaxID=2607827 RepID=UPI0025808112|nr:hypothetical protein [Moorena sp. SIO3B2]